MNRVVATLLAIAAVIVAGTPLARAGGTIETVVNGNITDVAWSPLAIPVPWKINDQGVINNCNNGNPLCVGGVSPITLQRAIDGMTAAFNTWQSVPTSRIVFAYAGTSTVMKIGIDNVHLTTWADGGTANCPKFVVATTPNFSLSGDMTVTNTNRDINNDGIIDLDPAVYPAGTFLKAGTIIDADMAWCPDGNDYVDVPLDTTTNTLDFVAVATHELGHFHGLSHSSLLSPLATMTPFVDGTADFDNDFRVLSQDDISSSSRTWNTGHPDHEKLHGDRPAVQERPDRSAESLRQRVVGNHRRQSRWRRNGAVCGNRHHTATSLLRCGRPGALPALRIRATDDR